MKQENVDFKGALESLAGRAGIELAQQTPEQRAEDQQVERLRTLLNIISDFFHDQLVKNATAEDARKYVAKRGLSLETVALFKIGYAPDQWSAGMEYLTSLGFSVEEMLQAGVITQSEDGTKRYDRFRHRLMIPIRDARGHVTGFGARAFRDDQKPKYLNSPQTPLFDKGRTLFALDLARRSIRETETAVIVEGYMDAIQAHQAGFTNVIAQMGTALTEAQLTLLAKYAHKLVIALDPDEAGESATLRGLQVAQSTLSEKTSFFDPAGTLRAFSALKLDIRVMTLPNEQDPDDLIRETPEKWTTLVQQATPILDYIIESGVKRVTPTMNVTDREAIAHELLPILIESKPQLHYSVQKLALRLRINERDLMGIAQQQLAALRPLPSSEKAQRRFAQRIDREPVNRPDALSALAESPPLAETPLTPSESVPMPAVVRRTGDPSPLERECLRNLLQQPELWAIINRKFSEMRPIDPKTRRPIDDPLLGALQPDDFQDSDYKAILSVFYDAMERQHRLKPFEYLQAHLPPELFVLCERLVSPTPLEDQVRGFAKMEMRSVQKEQERAQIWKRQSISEQTPILPLALQLRRKRLERECTELGYLFSEDNTYSPEYSRRRRLMSRIDVALQNLDKPASNDRPRVITLRR
jgi:DNA primase